MGLTIPRSGHALDLRPRTYAISSGGSSRRSKARDSARRSVTGFCAERARVRITARSLRVEDEPARAELSLAVPPQRLHRGRAFAHSGRTRSWPQNSDATLLVEVPDGQIRVRRSPPLAGRFVIEPARASNTAFRSCYSGVGRRSLRSAFIDERSAARVEVQHGQRLLLPRLLRGRRRRNDELRRRGPQVGDRINIDDEDWVVTDAKVVSERDVDFEIRVRRAKEE